MAHQAMLQQSASGILTACPSNSSNQAIAHGPSHTTYWCTCSQGAVHHTSVLAVQFESGAILLYVADKYGATPSPADRARQAKWVLLANATMAEVLLKDK
jgi:hypothetical protein